MPLKIGGKTHSQTKIKRKLKEEEDMKGRAKWTYCGTLGRCGLEDKRTKAVCSAEK